MLADREFNIVHDDRDAPIECETGSLDLPETGAVDALATYILSDQMTRPKVTVKSVIANRAMLDQVDREGHNGQTFDTTRVGGPAYYEYTLLYTDDILPMSDRAEDIPTQGDRGALCTEGVIHRSAQYVKDAVTVEDYLPTIDRSGLVLYPFYQEALSEGEDLPTNMMKPRGERMTMRIFVDSDHAGDSMTRRSRTGSVVFANQPPNFWCMVPEETTAGLSSKHRMMGIPGDEPNFVYGDNRSALANVSNPGFTLKKTSAAVAYHFVRDGCARDEWRTSNIDTHLNVADLLTKPLSSGEKRWRCVGMLLHHVVPK
ncbi:hypothetical protein THAOC_29627 [Thalassiosira oceanica]|uniref:Uncharacterized protein n=1 Tax=Thalassiosira oceanica TaxID=159749 RepID=K0RQW2_THAOC|nr:hypothetical protein THAOC_29627 [Thalassiosira oceanica]|eukprot:EJK51221.1 hypothetical protein THAOC_29627 [Thalassiosira oceanica]